MDMQALENFARSAIVILVNGLWQGAAIALVTWLVLRAFPRANASTRYAAWTLALVATLVVPVATSLSRIAFETPQRVAAFHSVTHEGIQTPRHVSSTLGNAPVVATSSFAIPPAPAALHLDLPVLITSSVFALWAVAVLALVVRLAVALLQLERLKRDALPLRIEYRDELVRWQALGDRGRDVRICVTDGIEVPVAVGLFDAMVLLPQHLLDRLDAQEIDQVSLHELAHLLRHDDWSNGFQRLVAALLFFNPAVWFIARQMDIEREVACDDYVLELTGAVRSYAYCLTKMAEITTWPHQPLAAPGVFVTRKNISIRIERLLRTGRAIGSSIAPATALAVIAGLALAVLVARAVTPAVAFAMPQVEPSLAASPQAPASASPMRSARPIPSPRIMASVPATSVPATSMHAARVAALAHAPVKVATERSSEQASFNGGCQGCDFANARLGGRDFSNQNLGGSNFANADLHGARFDRSDLNGTNFSDANLRDVSFVGANMTGCDLSGADVTGARFDRAVLTGCSVDIKRLSPNQAMQFLVHCTGCDFSHADLNGLDLHGLQITGADLSHVNLRDANLSGTTFKGVDFSGADFGGANLNGTTFYGCDLSNADLSHVDISHATFFGTSLGDVKMKR